MGLKAIWKCDLCVTTEENANFKIPPQNWATVTGLGSHGNRYLCKACRDGLIERMVARHKEERGE